MVTQLCGFPVFFPSGRAGRSDQTWRSPLLEEATQLCLTLVPEVFLESFRRKSELLRLALSFATGIRVALSSLLGIFKDWP